MFEFDPDKGAANLAKRGIDFVAAQALWRDPSRIIIPSAQHHHGEDRALVVGRIDGRAWVAIVVFRSERIRIISVRRARDYEEAAYEQARADHDRQSGA